MKYSVVRFHLDGVVEQFMRDLFINDLSEIGFDSFQEEETMIEAFLPTEKLRQSELDTLVNNFVFFTVKRYEIEELEDKNWNEEWEKNFFSPMIIADKCVIHSTFHKDYPQMEYDIIINPQMAFGTGHHATTTLIMEEMLAMNLHKKRVLDMGCGTAVLAILAEKLGATPITAIDIDEWCVRNSLKNISLNACQYIDVALGGAEQLTMPAFDVILANINRNILLRDIKHYVNVLKPNGLLLISGFYLSDLSQLKEKASKLSLSFLHYQTKNDWCMAVFSRVCE